jgi:hypothetical protein
VVYDGKQLARQLGETGHLQPSVHIHYVDLFQTKPSNVLKQKDGAGFGVKFKMYLPVRGTKYYLQLLRCKYYSSKEPEFTYIATSS